MTFTMTRSATESFTLTHAKYLASKVTADLKRFQHRYGLPNDAQINDYGTELALLLRDGYVSAYEFGVKRAERRVVSCYYKVDSAGNLTADDRPGGTFSVADITGADWFNYLWPTSAWWAATEKVREQITASLPIRRTAGEPPADGLGLWQEDRTYSSTGVALVRKTFRPYAWPQL